MSHKNRTDSSIIALDRFIQATRDSGYRNTTSALSELVDNSIQAGAGNVEIVIRPSEHPDYTLDVLVMDDGRGMDRATLRQALRFGGSSRFNDRKGFGRYGMGLPNASLSQSRRVEVFSWSRGQRPIYSYLDVDDVAAGQLSTIPSPRARSLPADVPMAVAKTGTLIVWNRCDRLDHKRVSTIARRATAALGRIYRYLLLDGVQITVNGEPVQPIDPLYVNTSTLMSGAKIFEQPLEYRIKATQSNGRVGKVGRVTVTFSELPIAKWRGLDNAEKRRLGIANGAGVSIVRGGREIDYGWFFMGAKRRENYDDWWRCEVRFDAVLDELFGITHTKQQIRPQESLLELLQPDIESFAKALNGRVRKAHLDLKAASLSKNTEQQVTDCFSKLEPLPRRSKKLDDPQLAERIARRCELIGHSASGTASTFYRIIEDKLDDPSFFAPVFIDGQAIAVVNERHRFYKKFYRLLQDEEKISAEEVRGVLDTVLLAAVRAEGLITKTADRAAVSRYRRAWGEALAASLGR